MKPNRDPRPWQEVMADLTESLPEVALNTGLDRDWLWYYGPSLAGDHNKAVRETLGALGFRFAPKGHPMPGGKAVGSWSHSCEQPRKRIFRRGRRNTSQHYTNNQHDEAAFNPIEALAALGV